jgi:L-ornithine Nalpha-acyltransferase
MQPGAILASKGKLAVRLTAGDSEIAEAQRLRYRVFYEELDARPDPAAAATHRDADRFDAFCDHLVVTHGTELVGTYRLLRQEVAEGNCGFYSQGEFDIAPVVAAHPNLRFLELGRSCVLKPYRTRPVVELLWQGIWDYVRQHRLDVMFGCASLEGTDAGRHAATLTFLARNYSAPPEWRVRALPNRRVGMNRLPAERINPKAALNQLPPLIKGYLRLGCYIGEGAVIDKQFNTIDVLILLPVSAINERYFSHFGSPTD